MFVNYLKIAYRNLLRYKGYSFINIVGLAIGITCCLLILLFIQHELSYDRYLENAQQIYRIYWESDNPQTRTPHPLAQALVKDFPEIESAVSLSPIWGAGLTRPKIRVRYGDKHFVEAGFYSADSTFFQVFDFHLKQGDPETALKEPFGIVISEDMARKYFPQEDPMGKILKVTEDEIDCHVTGIMENIPANTHFHFDFLISYVTLKAGETGDYYEWSDMGHYNYIRLKKNADPKVVEAKIPDWVIPYLNWPEEWNKLLRERQIGFRLQPITDIYLHSNLRWELDPTSSIEYIYLYSASAFLILILACINFINLSTARSARRAREVGVRKVVGGTRIQIGKQFLGESLLISLISLVLANLLVELVLPAFRNFTGKPLVLDFLHNSWLYAGFSLIILMVGIISGIYPAFYLSAFQPVKVLKGTLPGGGGNVLFRRVLVAVQFTIAITLIIGTLIVSSQLNFLRHKDRGFNSEQVIVVPLNDSGSLRERFESLKGDLLQHSAIVDISAVSNIPGERHNQNPVQWPSEDRQVQMSESEIDPDFFKTLEIEIVEGRGFSKDYQADIENVFMLNQTAARQFGWKTAIGQPLLWYDDEITRHGLVIGVVKDFNFQSLHKSIEPLIFRVSPSDYNYILIKLNTNKLSDALHFIKSKWEQFQSQADFDYFFLDENFNRLYHSEERMQTIFGIFTSLTLFIAGLGLFSLASFSVEKRTKEIGIRKVLGASASSIFFLLSQEFLKWVLLANIIAWPLAYAFMNQWLQNFAYKIQLHFWIFLLAAFLAIIIALITVSYQALKSAIQNPVKALRYE